MKFEDEDIGVRVLETVTAGLYDGTPNCLREYVQNSRDERAKNIEIYYENGKNDIVIKDDGEGMNKEELKFALSVGKSKKTDKETGWRGIGVWSGSSNCSKIIIITKKKNGKKLRVEIDNRLIRKGIDTGLPILQTLESATSEIEKLELGKGESDAQFTIVRLESILPTQYWIFRNEEVIKEYLQKTLPLSFNKKKFSFSKEIDHWLKKRNVTFPSIHVKFEGKEIFRPPFKSDIFFNHVVFKEFKEKNKLIAVAWFLTSNNNRVLQKPNKGIFFKMKGFTIGDENLVKNQHSGTYNTWQYGEIHIISKEIKENASRNNFEYNTELIKSLLDQVGKFVRDFQLQNQYQSDRIVSGRITKTEKLITKGDFDSAKEELVRAEVSLGRARSFPKDESMKGMKNIIDSQSSKNKKELKKLNTKIAKPPTRLTSKEQLRAQIKNLPPDLRKVVKIVDGQVLPVLNITDPIKKLLQEKTGSKKNEIMDLTQLTYGWKDIKGGTPLFVIDRKKKYRNYRFGILIYTIHDLFVNLYKHEKGKDSFKWFDSLKGDEKNQIFMEMLAIISWICRLIEHSEEYQKSS